jgi:diguanylate cyclase (GGDEF)-like protein
LSFLSAFDDRTLMACFCMLVTVFAVMLMALRAFHPKLAGLGSVTLGFATGALAMMLLFSAEHLPPALGTLGGGGLTFVSSILIYRGVLQFCRHQRPASRLGRRGADPDSENLCRSFFPLIYAVSAVSFALIAWFTLVTPREGVRVVAIAGTIGLTRWITSWTILRIARGRLHLLALGVMLGLIAMVSAAQALGGAFFAGAAHRLTPSHLETPTLLFGVLVVCIQGVLYLMMFGGVVTESIHEQAQLDYLTGILNRRGIESALDAELARTRRTGTCFSMLLLDVDHFKSINDQFGHAVGDDALRNVAQTVLRTVRIYDPVGRFGGDEFMLLLPQTDGTEAQSTADRILEAIRELPAPAKGAVVTVSIGATSCNSQEGAAEVMMRADAALYEAKRDGRNCVRFNRRDKSPALRSFSQDEPHPDRLPLLIGEDSLPQKA